MDGSIDPSSPNRNALLAMYLNGRDVKVSGRANIVLLAAENYSQRAIVSMTFSSNNCVGRSLSDFRKDGVAGLTNSLAKESATQN